MTSPFTTVEPQENRKKDPSEYIPWMRCVELPAMGRPGKLLVVRPLKSIEDFRKKDVEGWKGTLVVADVACLDNIEPAADEYGNPLPGFERGHQFRDQVVFPGYLNQAFRGYIGKTLIGTLYLGPNTKGKPPVMWRDLSGDPQATQRGAGFLSARPEFLVPTEAAFTSEMKPAPAQNVPSGQYKQDPWAQQASQAMARPTSAPPQSQEPVMNTLELMRQMAQGEAPGYAATDVPF